MVERDFVTAPLISGAPPGGGMGAPVTLLMAIHCHQPVGNFGFVFEEAYAKAYEPFLGVLERHPTVKLSLHYSGPLLDWLVQHRPALLERVRTLVRNGQIELLSAGYYEPILPLLPEADRQGQLAMMRKALRTHFGVDPMGMWLTERVWEPELPQTLAQAGLRYTMVDTNQFAVASRWLPPALQVQDESFWDVLGFYTTEYAGSSVHVFPSSKRLRYWIPFQPVERTLEFLKRLRRDEAVALTFADDGEKFGLWPKTHDWVYGHGWLDQFFGRLERERSWLSTATFREHVERSQPSGHVYLPCGSYEEMLEWSGGSFRNFFLKYPEADAMQQKMLRVSRQLQAVESSELRVQSSKKRQTGSRNSQLTTRNSQLLAQARQELYAGQCNCAYWHGVFGGLYLAHLRRAVYARLIGAEHLLRQARGMRRTSTGILTTQTMSVLIDPAAGGAITEWSLFGPRLNLLDTLTRRHEPYHEKLNAPRVQAAAVPAGVPPASIHDLLGVKEADLTSYVIYDDHRRTSFLDYGLERVPTLHDVVRSAWGERRLWSGGSFRAEPVRGSTRNAHVQRATMVRAAAGGRIRKSVSLSSRRPLLECQYTLDRVEAPVIGIEFNLALRDERYLAQPGERAAVRRFDIAEPPAGVRVTMELDPPARLYHFPVETISESEAGLERTYQGLCLVCFWTREASPRAWSTRIRWTVGTP